jgi:hypothetical protein
LGDRTADRSAVHHVEVASTDPVAGLLAEALRRLVDYVENRPGDATDDDDVRALEDVAHVLLQISLADRPRLVGALGDRHSRWLGLID